MGDICINLWMFVNDCAKSRDSLQTRLSKAVHLSKLGIEEFAPQLQNEWTEIMSLLTRGGTASAAEVAGHMTDAEAASLITRIAEISRAMDQWEAANQFILHGPN